MTSFESMFDFMTSSITQSFVMMAIDAVTSFKTYVNYAFQSKQELREILTLCSRWWNRYRL